MGGLLKTPKPQATPVPKADPVTVQAQFEAGEDDTELDKKKRQRAGKSALTVKRNAKNVGTSKGSGGQAGLTTGAN